MIYCFYDEKITIRIIRYPNAAPIIFTFNHQLRQSHTPTYMFFCYLFHIGIKWIEKMFIYFSYAISCFVSLRTKTFSFVLSVLRVFAKRFRKSSYSLPILTYLSTRGPHLSCFDSAQVCSHTYYYYYCH